MANRQFRFVHALTCSNASAFFYSESEVADQLRRGGHLCELMLGDELCRGYADIDVDVSDDPRPFEELHDEYLPLVRDACEVVQRYIKEALSGVGDPDYVLATRHGTKPDGSRKLSFRPYFKGWVSSRPVLGRFFDFINRCGEALLRFDIQPYGASSQKLAAILCSKSPADGRVLRPEREGDSPLDYLAQHWEESWPPLIWKGNPEAEAVASAMIGEGAVADVGWARDLLSCLSASRLNDYRDWIKVGFVLKSMGRASGEQDAFFQLWNEWSASGAKYDGELACRKKWDSFSSGRQNGVTVRTLQWMARHDSPAAFHRLEQRHSPEGTQTNAAVTQLLRDNVPQLAGLGDDTVISTEGDDIRFNGGEDLNGWIRRPSLIVDMEDGRWFGPITGAEFTLKTSFHGVAPLKVPSQVHHYQCYLERGLATIKPLGGDFDFHLACDDPFAKRPFIRYRSMTTGDNVIGKGGTKEFQALWTPAYNQHLKETLGESRVTNIINFGCTQNLVVGPSETRLHKGQICEALALALPQHVERTRYVSDGLSRGTFYVCDPSTNMWKPTDFATMKRSLLNKGAQEAANMTSCPLGPAELAYIFEHENDVLHAFGVDHCLDNDFTVKTLDCNPMLFALENGVVDLSETPVPRFRPARVDDYVGDCAAPFAYDEALAREHRIEVDTYLRQLFPFDDERELALQFVAYCLSGLQDIKVFAIATDERRGNNGKSTFIHFLELFFGLRVPEVACLSGYMIQDKDFVQQSSAPSNKNSHNGNLVALKGIRLLVADEFDSDTRIDTTLMREMVGGTDKKLYGRHVHKSSFFAFDWFSKIMFAFNEGSAPSMKGVPELYLRAVCLAFRGKFVPKVSEDAQPYTYPIDRGLKKKFPMWRSAFLDILLERFPDRYKMDFPPESSLHLRKKLQTEDNRLAPWLERNVVITNNDDDYIKMSALSQAIQNDSEYSRWKAGEIKREIANFCSASGLFCGSRNVITETGCRSKLPVAQGMKFKDDFI